MQCILCGSEKVIIQDKMYPYYCQNCETAFRNGDIVIVKQVGITRYRRLIGATWERAKVAITRNAERI